MTSRFSNFSFNGSGDPDKHVPEPGDQAASFDDVQEAEAALADKFDRLNRKWQAAAEKLRSIVGGCGIHTIWINVGYFESSGNYLGFVGGEICYAERVRKPSPGNWNGILNCSAKNRIMLVQQLPHLIKAVQKAVHERREILPDQLDEAIEKMSDTLEK